MCMVYSVSTLLLLIIISIIIAKSSAKSSAKPAKAGKGWARGFLSYFVPKKDNEAHLPDDKNPSVSNIHQQVSFKSNALLCAVCTDV